jgi:hypothetical protein
MKLASIPSVLLLSLIPTSVSGLPADKGENLDMVARDDGTVEGVSCNTLQDLGTNIRHQQKPPVPAANKQLQYCIVEDQMCHYQYEGRMFRHPCLNISQACSIHPT